MIVCLPASLTSPPSCVDLRALQIMVMGSAVSQVPLYTRSLITLDTRTHMVGTYTVTVYYCVLMYIIITALLSPVQGEYWNFCTLSILSFHQICGRSFLCFLSDNCCDVQNEVSARRESFAMSESRPRFHEKQDCHYHKSDRQFLNNMFMKQKSIYI